MNWPVWVPIRDGDPRGLGLYLRHYSAKGTPRRRGNRFVGPGESLVLVTPQLDAMFIWRHSTIPRKDQQVGVECYLFRNEGAALSSELIREAVRLAWERWPAVRLWTYVNPRRIRSTNPGACFRAAGWRRLPDSKHPKRGRLCVLELSV